MSSHPRVVIVGAGFGGLEAAKRFAGQTVDVTVADQRNHHLFQPLLYQVATAALSPADIAAPIRSILARADNVRVMLDSVQGIIPLAKRVSLVSGRSLVYDWLVLATGARHSYFGRDDWALYAPGIKTIEDATAVRRRVLLSLERAETELNLKARSALLTFVVVGGIEVLSIVGDQFQLQGGLWDFLGFIGENSGWVGAGIILVFILSWLISTIIYRVNKYDDIEVIPTMPSPPAVG